MSIGTAGSGSCHNRGFWSGLLRSYVFLVILAVLVPLALVQPFSGLLSYTWISYFNPHEYTYGFTRHLPVALMVAIPTLLGLLFTTERKLPTFTRETFLLLSLWIWFLLTTANVSQSAELTHHWVDTEQKLGLVSKTFLMLFASLMLVTNAKRLRHWYLVTAGIFAIFATKSFVFGILTAGQYKVYGPPNSMLADNNDFGLAMNIALPMFLCLARTESSRPWRWVFRAAIPMGIVTVVLTFSRGAMLGLLILLMVWAMKSRYKVLGAAGLSLVVLILFLAAPQAWVQRMETLRTAPQTDASARSRLRAWEFAARFSRDHPLLGGGFETFTQPLYARYAIEETHGPHSIYFQMLAEHGIPGLLLFLALIASCYLSCRTIVRDLGDKDSPGHLGEYARMVQLSLVTFLVSGAFLGRAYFDLFYQLVATVIILKYLASQERDTQELELTESIDDVEFDHQLVQLLPHTTH
jgi:probable O-glycosylation ligase (exosortase A-associated)